jgi:ABC-type amino acid transport substrate-binding protein
MGKISKSGNQQKATGVAQIAKWASRTKWCLALLVVVLGTVGLGGCRERDAYLQRVQQAGVLRVGMDPSWPPFEFIDPESGKIAGLDVDLGRAIGQRLGVEVVFVSSGWEGLHSALRAGQFDAIISALPYDPWRTQGLAYSISYFNAGPVIVVHTGEGAIAQPKDLAGRTVHVEFGSEGDVQARRLQKKIDDLHISPHDTAREALAAAVEDADSAAIVDAISARLFIRDDGRLKIVGKPLYDELYVIAVHPQATSLQEAIDRALINMRERGELEALLDRWL